MKKLFTLITFCLLSAVSAMAETTTIYERGTKEETAWSAADIAETAWAQQWNSSLAIENNSLYSKIKNAGWTATKTITTTKNSIVSFSATLYGGQAPGRSGSYDYIRIGGVELRLNGQDQVASVAIDGVASNLSGFTRGGEYTISGTINQATGVVSYKVTGKSSGTGTGTTNTAVSSAVFGHNRAGSEGYEIVSYLSKISISEEKQEVSNVDYTINYKFESATIKSVNASSTVGNTINAESPITIEGQKYYATSETSITLGSDAEENVLDVELRKAGEWNWTVKSSLNTTLATGVCIEGGSFTVAIPRYILSEGTLYETTKGSDWFHKTYDITQDNQEETITYNATSITNVVLYAEAENLPGATSGNGNTSRTSMGLTAYGTNLPVGELASGKYKIYMHGANGNSAARAVSFNDGETALVQFSIVGSNNNQDFESEEFTVANATNITMSSEGSSSSGVDFFYIVKTGEAALSPAINASGFGTFSAAFPVQIEGAKVYAAQLSEDGTKLVCTEVEGGKVPAGVGVILVKDGEGDVTATAIAEATAISDNALAATTLADGTTATKSGDALVLSGDAFKLYSGATFAANKAYLPYSATAKLTLVFDDATGAVVVEEDAVEAAPAKYINAKGQLVIGNYNALGQQMK